MGSYKFGNILLLATLLKDIPCYPASINLLSHYGGLRHVKLLTVFDRVVGKILCKNYMSNHSFYEFRSASCHIIPRISIDVYFLGY